MTDPSTLKKGTVVWVRGTVGGREMGGLPGEVVFREKTPGLASRVLVHPDDVASGDRYVSASDPFPVIDPPAPEPVTDPGPGPRLETGLEDAIEAAAQAAAGNLHGWKKPWAEMDSDEQLSLKAVIKAPAKAAFGVAIKQFVIEADRERMAAPRNPGPPSDLSSPLVVRPKSIREGDHVWLRVPVELSTPRDGVVMIKMQEVGSPVAREFLISSSLVVGHERAPVRRGDTVTIPTIAREGTVLAVSDGHAWVELDPSQGEPGANGGPATYRVADLRRL